VKDIAISVIIPVYNTEKYVEETINSVLDNAFKNYEIICVNDGSTDHSLNILNEYAGKYDHIKVVNQENKGLSAARNIGFRTAVGKYIYFLDSDDKISPDALGILYECLEKNQLDVLFFSGDSFYENEELKEEFPAFMEAYLRNGIYEKPCKGLDMLSQLQQNSDYTPSACLQIVRRQFLIENEIDFPEGIMHEDNLFSFKVIFQAERAFCVNDIYFHRRVRETSLMTTAKSHKNLLGYYISLIKVVEYLADKELTLEEQESVGKRIRALNASVSKIYASISEEERDIFYEKLADISEYYRLLFKSTTLQSIEREECVKKKLKKTKKELASVRQELEGVKKSRIYRFVSSLKRPFRKIKKCIKK
jgi:glycosyltransferase involved in cell wall biosynthesis